MTTFHAMPICLKLLWDKSGTQIFMQNICLLLKDKLIENKIVGMALASFWEFLGGKQLYAN